MKRASLAILICFLTLFAQAQSSWGLKECITYGLEHHLSNEIYRNNIEKAKQMKNENVAFYLPQVKGDIYFDDNLKKQTQIFSDETSGDVREIQLGKHFVTTASVEVEQALYDKFLLSSLRGLKPNNAIARLNFQQNQDGLICNISQMYVQVYVLKQQAALLQENIRKYETLHEIVKLQVEKGVTKKIEADRIFVALNNTQSQLVVVESNYELSVNRLKNAMGMDLGEQLPLPDSLDVIPIDTSASAISGFNAENKTEIQIQKNNLKLLEVQKNRTSAGYFPKLSFYARYGAQSFSNEFSSAFNNWHDYSSLGLKLNVPIFDSFQKGAQIKQSKINTENALHNLKLSEDAFQLQYQNANTQLKRAQLNLENTRQNVKLAKDVFDNSALQYQQGVSPLSEFINSETSFKEAQSNYVGAMLNYYMAVIDLEKAKGTLEAFYRNL